MSDLEEIKKKITETEKKIKNYEAEKERTNNIDMIIALQNTLVALQNTLTEFQKKENIILGGTKQYLFFKLFLLIHYLFKILFILLTRSLTFH